MIFSWFDANNTTLRFVCLKCFMPTTAALSFFVFLRFQKINIMSKIIGIGNALVDVIVNIPDESLLKTFSLPKGGMEMIDIEKKRNLHAAIGNMQQTLASGGSTSNTIHGLARLGASAGYIGKVKKDEMGDFFEKDMRHSHIQPHLIYSDIDTGIATTLMTCDAERTFATYLGAASTMNPDEIDHTIFKDYDYIHVEGYLIFNKDLLLRICKLAKENKMTISMDMASFNLVEQNREFIEMLLKDYVDIIFANEEEAKAFTGKDDEEALQKLAEYCRIAIVKLGAKGSITMIDGEFVSIPAGKAHAIDKNGAGDIYAAGFLYGIMNHFSPEKTGKLASKLADELVQTVGAKLSDEQWRKILSEKDLF